METREFSSWTLHKLENSINMKALLLASTTAPSAINLTGIDWAIVALYALTIVTVGLLVTRKPKNSEAYFLAGRSLRWPMIGASLFAANISAEHFVALAGSGFAVGIAIGAWEWAAVFCLAPLILIFLPCMEPLPQTLHSQRHGGGCPQRHRARPGQPFHETIERRATGDDDHPGSHLCRGRRGGRLVCELPALAGTRHRQRTGAVGVVQHLTSFKSKNRFHFFISSSVPLQCLIGQSF